ncbi:MAG: Crp/Fnr family transcriptional regulator [Rikenellaceae bacterium]|jgi:CRP-like cAMP-binding protein|nr:Crp/Fnr family transcriptional regulator [Rikenellaceae bacterium]
MMFENLADCKLFRDVDPDQIAALCEQHGAVKRLARGDVAATQGTRCSSLVILAEGQLQAEIADRGGERIPGGMLTAPVVVAPGALFADHPVMPATLTARTPVTLVSIPRDEFVGIMQREGQVLRNFLEIVSSGGRFASEQAIYLAVKTIKGKIARYLLDLAAKEGGGELHNPLTQREMADLFGVTRPALARALGEMSAEGSIYVQGKRITILFEEKLRQYIKA